MRDGLRLALTTLTVARVRGPRQVDRRTAGVAMSLAPLVGLLLALPAAALLAGGRELLPYPSPPLLPAALAVALLALLTRGLHLDGLADTTDGLASYKEPEGARAVMRSPEVGPLGLAAVVLVLLVQVVALSTAAGAGRGTAALVLAVVVGRLAVTVACTPAFPAAGGGGLGAAVAGTVRRAVPWVWLGVVLVAAAGVEAVEEAGRGLDQRVFDAVRPAVAVLLALALARVLLRHCVRRLGGVTGDVLGMLVEVTTTVVLVVMALEAPLDVRVDRGWS